jgi:Xaa-Pro aminopeptidase
MNFIVTNEAALLYEAGFSCDNGIFLSLGKEKYFLTDGRYTLDANEGVKGAVVIVAHDIVSRAATLIRLSGAQTLFIDPKEWSVAKWEIIAKKSGAKLISKPSFSPLKRSIKNENEIEILKKAVKIGAECFTRLASKIDEMIGESEQELYRVAKNIFSDGGARNVSFDPIAVINGNSAKPHAKPSTDVIKKGDLLLVDAGVMVEGYCSDRTRVIEVGSGKDFVLEQKFSNPLHQEVYDIVLKAHDEAIKQARPGMRGKDIDAIARGVISEAGYGKEFVHSLGHGVGLEIHELPVISQKSATVLEEGMVFTIEPGIYLAGKFGVRIEDMVVMKKDGVEVL